MTYSQIHSCLIDGECYAADAVNDEDPILACKPDFKKDAWFVVGCK